MWFQNRRTKNRRTADDERSAQVEPGHTVSECSDDSCGDAELQDTSCATTITTSARISSDAARLGRDVDVRRHAVTSRDDDDDDYVGNHGNRAAAAAAADVSGWTDLCRSRTLRHGVPPMSTCHAAAVTIGQS